MVVVMLPALELLRWRVYSCSAPAFAAACPPGLAAEVREAAEVGHGCDSS